MPPVGGKELVRPTSEVTMETAHRRRLYGVYWLVGGGSGGGKKIV